MNNTPGTITLDEDYYIDVDSLNFMLKKIKITADVTKDGTQNKNAGRRCDVTIGYCGTLENALDLYSRELIRNGIHNSVTALSIEDMKVILHDIKTAVTGWPLTLNVKKESK